MEPLYGHGDAYPTIIAKLAQSQTPSPAYLTSAVQQQPDMCTVAEPKQEDQNDAIWALQIPRRPRTTGHRQRRHFDCDDSPWFFLSDDDGDDDVDDDGESRSVRASRAEEQMVAEALFDLANAASRMHEEEAEEGGMDHDDYDGEGEGSQAAADEGGTDTGELSEGVVRPARGRARGRGWRQPGPAALKRRKRRSPGEDPDYEDIHAEGDTAPAWRSRARGRSNGRALAAGSARSTRYHGVHDIDYKSMELGTAMGRRQGGGETLQGRVNQHNQEEESSPSTGRPSPIHGAKDRPAGANGKTNKTLEASGNMQQIPSMEAARGQLLPPPMATWGMPMPVYGSPNGMQILNPAMMARLMSHHQEMAAMAVAGHPGAVTSAVARGVNNAELTTPPPESSNKAQSSEQAEVKTTGQGSTPVVLGSLKRCATHVKIAHFILQQLQQEQRLKKTASQSGNADKATPSAELQSSVNALIRNVKSEPLSTVKPFSGGKALEDEHHKGSVVNAFRPGMGPEGYPSGETASIRGAVSGTPSQAGTSGVSGQGVGLMSSPGLGHRGFPFAVPPQVMFLSGQQGQGQKASSASSQPMGIPPLGLQIFGMPRPPFVMSAAPGGGFSLPYPGMPFLSNMPPGGFAAMPGGGSASSLSSSLGMAGGPGSTFLPFPVPTHLPIPVDKEPGDFNALPHISDPRTGGMINGENAAIAGMHPDHLSKWVQAAEAMELGSLSHR